MRSAAQRRLHTPQEQQQQQRIGATRTLNGEPPVPVARSARATAAAGVYQPRRGGVGGGLARLSEEQRRQLAATLGAELCLFKYCSDPFDDRFGLPLAGPPHAIYLDAPAAGGGGGAAAGGGCGGAPFTVLNRGKALRPKEDERGWKWRESLAAKRDESLIFASPSTVVRVEKRHPDAPRGERRMEP